ncbi:MAG: hypothetical protein K2X47_12510 [Bdellovibrionales bacterium]|nr:hypothetical protein [Bdellovibrionales bacterium]
MKEILALLLITFPLLPASTVAAPGAISQFERLRERSVRLAESVIQAIGTPTAYNYHDYPDPIKNGQQIVMSFELENIPSIQTFGFSNIFQTTTTGGGRYSSYRLLGDAGFINYKRPQYVPRFLGIFFNVRDVNLSFHPTELHPKSAFLTPSGAENYQGYQRKYGRTYAVFKNEIWSRVGISQGDSLAELQPMIYKTGNEGNVPVMLNQWFRKEIPEWNGENEAFAEALIWGPIDFRDVDTLYVNSEEYSERGAKKKLHEVCLRYGIKLKTYVSEGNWSKSRMTQVREVLLKGKVPPSDPGLLTTIRIIEHLKLETSPVTRLLLIDRLAFLGEPAGLKFLAKLAAQHLATDPTLKQISISGIEKLQGDDLDYGPQSKKEYLRSMLAQNREVYVQKLTNDFAPPTCSTLASSAATKLRRP